MNVLTINGVDFSAFVPESGIKWTRNDLDHSSSGRTLDGVMHRRRTAIKVKLSCTLRRLEDADMRRLNEALLPETVEVRYYDPIDGDTTRTFYGSKVSSTIQTVVDGSVFWEGTQFDLTEV